MAAKTGFRKGERAWETVAEAARDAQHADSHYAICSQISPSTSATSAFSSAYVSFAQRGGGACFSSSKLMCLLNSSNMRSVTILRNHDINTEYIHDI